MMRRLNYLVMAAAITMAMATGCKSGGDRYDYRDTGITAMDAGDYEGAIAAFDMAVNSSKGLVGAFDVDVLKYRAEAEFMSGDYTASVHTYDVLIEIDKERPEYLNLRCIAKAQAGDLPGAQADFRRSGELDPDKKAVGRQDALLAAGAAMEAGGQPEQAMALYTEAEGAGEGGARLYNRMGLCRMVMSDEAGALTYFSQGLASEDGAAVPELYFNMAVAYENQGEFGKALEQMEQYVAVHGSDEEAEREIAFLKTR